MNKLILLGILSFLGVAGNAQDARIIGKWKIIAVDNGVYHDYKKDSTYLTKKLRDSLTGQRDSAMSVEMLSMFVRQYADYYFYFDERLNYKEIRAGKTRVDGSYTVNSSLKLVELWYGNGENRTPHNFKYAFTGENLRLSTSSPYGDEMELTLERER